MSDAGMRFKRIEVRNFGTWTGASAHTFSMNRAGAVIAGENGAGKSTMMDALITLFSSGNKGAFNAAAVKGGKSSRNIADYYKGTHGNTEDGDTKQSRAIVLRSFGDESMTMMLLAVMENAQGDVLTVAKSLFITATGEQKWRYFTSDRDLNINTHFHGYATGRDLSARANRFGFEIHDSLSSYWSAVAEGIGLPNADHAKRAFNTMIVTMSVPEMSSVTDFVRDHILPPMNLLEDGENYIQLLRNNGAIQEEIRRTKRRAEGLEEIVEIIDGLEDSIQNLKTAQMSETRISAAQQYVLFHNFRHGKAAKEREHRATMRRLLEIVTRTRVLNEGLDDVKRARLAGGTADVDRLRRDLASAEAMKASKDEQLGRLLHTAKGFVQVGSVDDDAGWNRIVKAAHQAQTDADAAISENEAFLQGVNDEIRTAEVSVRSLEAEHASLMKNKSGVDRELIADRDALAARLSVRPEDLPFFAEIVQVKPEESAVWEHALNKLLRGVATVILVPTKYYAKAKSALSHIKGRSFIRIQDVWEDDMGLAQGAGLANLSPRAAAHLFDIKEDSPFGRYAEQTLSQQANHICISDDDLHIAHKRAVAPSGVVISSQSRTEKDNRVFRNVLGWSMEGKLAVVKAQIDGLQADLTRLREKRDQAIGGITTLRARHKATEMFLFSAPDSWEAVNPAESTAAVAQIRENLSALEAQDERSGLAQEEARLTEELKTLSEEKDRLNKASGQMENTIAFFGSNMIEAAKQLAFLRENGLTMSVSDYKSLRGLVRDAMADAGFTGAGLLISQDRGDITTLFHTITGTVNSSISRMKKDIDKAENVLTNRTASHAAVFAEDQNGLSFSLRGADRTTHERRQGWRERLVEVRDRDLQSAESRAKELSRAQLAGAVTQIRLSIKQYESDVRALVGGINQAMAGNVYNPRSGSHAMISLTNAKDPYHQDLERLLEASLDGIQTKSDSEFYADAAKIAEFVKDDGSQTQKVRRQSLSNLANRYNASVKERVAQADGVDRVVRNITGAGALSGGEKERMNVFLLSAALKTVFRSQTRPELSLGAFVVDEAFSKSSDESTRAAIEVVSSFGHQMIIATPMAKLLPFEDVSENVFLVSRPQNAHSVKEVIKMRTLVDGVLDAS